MSSGTSPVLKPITVYFQTDEIEAIYRRVDNGKGRYYYVTWRHGKFLNGFYDHNELQQRDPEVLEQKLKEGKAKLKVQSSKSPSKASFIEKVSHPLCEWKCGDHGAEGTCKRIIRDHAIPQREYDRVGTVHLV